MPKVYHVKARKDYPEHGIKKGEMYYHWALYRGRKQYSKEYPAASQLTGSAYQATLLGFQEALGKEAENEETTGEELRDALQNVADEIESLGEEQETKRDSMPEGLQAGEVGELLERRKEACEEIASSLREQADEIETYWEEFTSEWGEDEPEKLGEAEGAYAVALLAWRGAPTDKRLETALEKAWTELSPEAQRAFDENALRLRDDGRCLITPEAWRTARKEALDDCRSILDTSGWEVE